MITWCGKMSKQVIEPYTFQCKTNIEEHNDMVNKINEIVGVVNEMDVEEITKDITALESEVSTQGNEIDALNADVAELPTKTEVSNADVTAVAVDKTGEGIEIQLTRPAGVLEDSVALPFINTATLIPTSTERAFKIRFTYTDGTQYDTNEFVIPEGGGTDVSVTGVTVEDGTAPNSFKVAIQLSDASTIASNDYEIDIPAQQNTYPTSVSGTLSGATLNLTIGLNNSTNVTGTADLSAFLTKTEASTTYATKTEVTAVDTKVTAIGVTSEGNNVTVNGSSATIVKSVSGQVTDGNLKITVNGVESGDIPLPDTIKIIESDSNLLSISVQNIPVTPYIIDTNNSTQSRVNVYDFGSGNVNSLGCYPNKYVTSGSVDDIVKNVGDDTIFVHFPVASELNLFPLNAPIQISIPEFSYRTNPDIQGTFNIPLYALGAVYNNTASRLCCPVDKTPATIEVTLASNAVIIPPQTITIPSYYRFFAKGNWTQEYTRFTLYFFDVKKLV